MRLHVLRLQSAVRSSPRITPDAAKSLAQHACVSVPCIVSRSITRRIRSRGNRTPSGDRLHWPPHPRRWPPSTRRAWAVRRRTALHAPLSARANTFWACARSAREGSGDDTPIHPRSMKCCISVRVRPPSLGKFGIGGRRLSRAIQQHNGLPPLASLDSGCLYCPQACSAGLPSNLCPEGERIAAQRVLSWRRRQYCIPMNADK